MSPTHLLVANRGEIAIRVMRAAAELGMRTLAVFSEDDVRSLHTRKADHAQPLRGTGAAAYLDAEQIVALAKRAGCDAIHPGYGFLSENAAFARRCAEEGITFVGPRAETLDLFGDKGQARVLAERCGVPVLPGTSGPTSLEQAREFLEALGDGGSVMIKALAGGGGRGMRPVHHVDELADAYTRCRSEAHAAFGLGSVYIEQLIPRARHIEVQVVGDGSGSVSHLWERECSIQRQNQKIIEVAPSPGLPGGLRDRLTAAAVRLAEEVRYESLGTFEFLVDDASGADQAAFAFNEANPRLQVEHTVTEEVTGIDLVKVQLQLADGRSLAELGLRQADVPEPRGFAMQVRINMETMGTDGVARPAGGTLTAFEVPSGPGLRVDSCGYVGYTVSPRFDSLLAKLVGHSPSGRFADLVTRTYRALCEFKIEGVPTNIAFLQSLLKHPDVVANRVYTRFVEDHIAELVAPDATHQRLFFDQPAAPGAQLAGPALAGATVDAVDPLAVLDYGKTGAGGPTLAAHEASDLEGPEGSVAIRAPMQGTIVGIDVQEGDLVHDGQQLLVMDAMKVEHVITAVTSGVVQYVAVSRGDAVFEGHPLVFIQEAEVEASERGETIQADPDHVRPDLAEVRQRHAVGLDAARPDAVEKRRKTGHRTARENVEDLCDAGSFVEYGPLVIAGQRLRRPLEELIQQTPADGLVAGIGRVNGDLFDESRSRCMVLSYDYTVLAGTQGMQNHHKKDRMFELAREWRLPVVFFTEGGGGRPGDTDSTEGGWTRRPGLQLLRAAQRPGTAGRDYHGQVFCRQRGAARLLRRHHRHRRLQHRDRWPGHDRRWRPRGLPPRRGRPHGRAGAERGGRHRGRRRGRGGGGGEEVPLLLPGARRALGVCRSATAARDRSGESTASLRRPEGHRDAGRYRLRAGDPAPLRPRYRNRVRQDRGTAAGAGGQQPHAPGRRHRQRKAPTRLPASCSCAMRSTSPSCSSATAPASWSARRARRRRWCATPPACS